MGYAAVTCIDSDILIIDEESGGGKIDALLDEYRSE